MVYQVAAKEILQVAFSVREINDTMQKWMRCDVAADRELQVDCC